MTKTAVALVLSLAATVPASAEVSFREYHGDVYGSDGTRIHRFGGDTYIRQPNGREVNATNSRGR